MEKSKHNPNKDFYGKNLSGIEILIRSLIEEDVDVVFGCPRNAFDVVAFCAEKSRNSCQNAELIFN